MKKQKAEPSAVNLLNLIPDQNIKSEKSEDGFSVLLKPKYRHPLFVKYALPRLKSPNYKIKLDDVGSFIWDLCDGRNNVKEIGHQLKEKWSLCMSASGISSRIWKKTNSSRLKTFRGRPYN